MKIIVVGCGKVGTTLISNFTKEGYVVVAVDTNAEVISELNNIYDVMSVCGNGADCDVLIEAGAEKADLVIGTTGSDELNMLCCFLAKRMGAKYTACRIRNPEYNDQSLYFMKQELNIDLAVNPEMIAAREAYNILKFPSAVNIETFSARSIEMMEFVVRPESKLKGLKLMDIRRQFQGEYLVGVVRRGEEVFVPDGNFEIREGDMISITASPIEMQKLLRKLSALQKSAKNIMIVGASKTAFYLAKMLTDAGNSVKIIERDKQRCEMFSNGLPGAVVINGDGASQELLLEEGIDKVDAFVALTGMDEENILLSYFAQAKNVPTVIPKVNRNEFVSMAQSFGLYSMVSSKKSVLDVISRYVRALENSQGSNVENLYKLMDGKAEALEFKVGSDFEYVAIPLKRLDLKSNIRIAGIIRGRKTILPTGDDEILAGDKVIVLAAGHRIGKLSDIIA